MAIHAFVGSWIIIRMRVSLVTWRCLHLHTLLSRVWLQIFQFELDSGYIICIAEAIKNNAYRQEQHDDNEGHPL